jgi:hypothetical protein
VGVRRLTRAASRSEYNSSKQLGDDLALSKVSQLTVAHGLNLLSDRRLKVFVFAEVDRGQGLLSLNSL